MRDRPSSRLIILDPQDHVLLFHFDFASGPLAGDPFWATPGGGLEPGESYAQAARRELLEETGLTQPVSPEIARREAHFLSPKGEKIRGLERYFGLRVQNRELDFSRHTTLEQHAMRRHYWWSMDELAQTHERIHPVEIADLALLVP